MASSFPVSQRVGPEAAASPGARERILTAATELFHRFGYEGTSVTRIARAAKMVPANIYWHFPSKQDILVEVLKALYVRDCRTLAEAVPDSGSPSERLYHYVRTYVRNQLTGIVEDANFSYRTLEASLPSDEREELKRLARQWLDLLRDILQQGTDQGVFEVDDLQATSFAISTMCEYAFTWHRSGGRLDIDEVCELYCRLVLRMVEKRPRRPL
jgi:AcrR family transcriptional regulator